MTPSAAAIEANESPFIPNSLKVDSKSHPSNHCPVFNAALYFKEDNFSHGPSDIFEIYEQQTYVLDIVSDERTLDSHVETQELKRIENVAQDAEDFFRRVEELNVPTRRNINSEKDVKQALDSSPFRLNSVESDTISHPSIQYSAHVEFHFRQDRYCYGYHSAKSDFAQIYEQQSHVIDIESDERTVASHVVMQELKNLETVPSNKKWVDFIDVPPATPASQVSLVQS
jgi:hypothetical protein